MHAWCVYVCVWQWLKNFFNKNQLRNFLLLFFRRFFAAQSTHTHTHFVRTRRHCAHRHRISYAKQTDLANTHSHYTRYVVDFGYISAHLILQTLARPHIVPSSWLTYFSKIFHRLSSSQSTFFTQYNALISARGKVLS